MGVLLVACLWRLAVCCERERSERKGSRQAVDQEVVKDDFSWQASAEPRGDDVAETVSADVSGTVPADVSERWEKDAPTVVEK